MSEVLILKRVVKMPLIITFTAIAGFAIMLAGYMFKLVIR